MILGKSFSCASLELLQKQLEGMSACMSEITVGHKRREDIEMTESSPES